MRMMNKKWDNELYNGEFNEKDIITNNEEENYSSAYWNYKNNGDDYAE